MIDFSALNSAEKKLAKLHKGISFLDRMVKMVFYSTFIFTIAAMFIAYIKDWESVLNTISERWYTVMIGELVVTGGIKAVKDITEVILAYLEKKGE